MARDSSLRVKANQLIIHFNDDGSERSIPIEDIGTIVLENQKITVSCPLLSALSSNNVALVFCDSKQMPQSMLMTLDGNSIQQEVFRSQLDASIPLRKNIWRQLVKGKIVNQARLLDKLDKDGSILYTYANNVKSGDSDNREGIAARVYWSKLFDNFERDRFGDAPNNMLNYGYSILRSSVARSLIGTGLLPIMGVFHKNRYNAFPLADDVMEPFRPFVDEIVYYLYENGETELTREVKAHLLEALTCDTWYDGMLKPLMVGLSSTTASLSRCYSGDARKLTLPLIPLD